MLHHRTATTASARTASPRYTKPDFRDGSTLEERDKSGRSVGRFRVGKLLGRGGFAKCYEVTDFSSNDVLACKVIDRASLQKSKTLQKLHSEIAIHRRMKHKNIVNFLRTFQDEWFVYILLEKCSNQTLMEIAKTRSRFSISETQHIMMQSLAALQYMHENAVIHRDLKLGNMMMDSGMNVKIGDFGLAAELQYDGERKRTICGTPNYIAPEILAGDREGHSFEVDVWSLGVILYTLLVGDPPFQTSDVKATYNRIKHCRYTFPAHVHISELGKDLIARILQSRPDRRPTLVDIRKHPFFAEPIPPTSAPLTLFPENVRRRMEREGLKVSDDKPREALKQLWTAGAPTTAQPAVGGGYAGKSSRDVGSARGLAGNKARTPNDAPLSARTRTNSVPTMFTGNQQQQPAAPKVNGWCGPSSQPPSPRGQHAPVPQKETARTKKDTHDDDEERNHLTAIHDKLHQTFNGGDVAGRDDEVAPPQVWVTDYADFSGKYGLAYRLNTGHSGVHFNDSTKMIWEPITNRSEYYARVKENINGVVHAQDKRESFGMDTFPEALNKKVTLIKYFKSYLAKVRGQRDGIAVVNCSPFVSSTPVLLTEPNMVSDMVYVKRWLLTRQAMIFRLSNKTIQVCFLDKAEVILSSESKVVTYTEPSGRRRTIPLSSVASQSEDIADRLKYTKDILCKLINNREL